MSERKSSFVQIDELQGRVDIETACRFYGVDPEPLERVGRDIRTQCFLNCGKSEETGNRAIAIDANSPVKRWRCHQYGCGKGGNLVTLCDLLKPGANCDGRQPKGDRFKEIREDLRRMVGENVDTAPVKSKPTAKEPAQEEPKINLPLAESPNERARGLTSLDERFLVVPDENMNRHAAAYVRQHPFLTEDVCREHRCGYLPRPGSGGDRRGGTLQGMWVYGYLNENGEPLTWFGRNLQFEQRHADWVSDGRNGKEPAKFHFVKGFHRGLELYGQHEWNVEEVQRHIRDEIGSLLLVEGPNDRIALGKLGVPAFAICSNIITREQAKHASDKAREIGVPVGVMFDNDVEGENGARQSIPLLAQYGPVQFAWSALMYDGQFKNRQPESLSKEEWQIIHDRLCRRTTNE
ncbi:MAG: hypothetical protein HOK71_09710 [Planctomycetaceae bacterium]|nr:hypothetical protein [Planctomycetaceae bacterium]MBT6484935.1 hypothetical protein [Planctomycetaceae bacterium]